MNKKIQLTLAALVIIAAAAVIMFSSIQNRPQKNEFNQERKIPTTVQAPAQAFSDPDNLHYIFEEMSGFKLGSTEKNKKITYYIYEFTNEDANQEQDVFLEFCEELEKNGYVLVSNSADGAGYINQYELLFENLHYMVFTESSPDKIVLSVVDYNEEI